METVQRWILVIAIGLLAFAACGLIAALVFAYRSRQAHRTLLKSLAHLNSRVSDIDQQFRLLTKALNDAGTSFGLDPSRTGYGTPADIILGPTDTYEQLDQAWGSIRDATGRRESSTAIEGDRTRTAVIVIVGQSNAANHGTGRLVARHCVDNFSLYDGKCYHAADPLLGASGDGGNFATRFGDKLIEGGLFDRVILAPIAMGGTMVEQWAEEGMFNRRIPALIRRLYDAGLRADFVLWQQGEGNPGVGDIGGRQYRKNLLEVIRTFRRYGVSAPFFVSLTTTCGGPHPNAKNIRDGQQSAVNPKAAIYQGADTDMIGLEYRWDACHFNEVGLDMAASLWLEVIATYCRSAQPSAAPAECRGIEFAGGGQHG
jgi:hypothetical protein